MYQSNVNRIDGCARLQPIINERCTLRQRIECARAARGPRRKERTLFLLNNDDSCALPSEMLVGMESFDEMSILVFKSGLVVNVISYHSLTHQGTSPRVGCFSVNCAAVAVLFDKKRYTQT